MLLRSGPSRAKSECPENELKARDSIRVQVSCLLWIGRLMALRGPGESYSDAILWLAKG
jgi:hypothetical protein